MKDYESVVSRNASRHPPGEDRQRVNLGHLQFAANVNSDESSGAVRVAERYPGGTFIVRDSSISVLNSDEINA